MKIDDDAYKNYNAIHDVLTEVFPDKKEWSNEEIDFEISKLPREDQLMGVAWGWSDTVFRDKLYTFLKNED